MHPDPTDHLLAARLVALALLAAVLCNGAVVYLKRTGLIDGDGYRAYWSNHCKSADPARAMKPAGPRCCAEATAEDEELRGSDAQVEFARAYQIHLTETSGPELALKLVKDVFGLALIAYCIVLLARRAVPAPEIREAWPVCVLLGYVTLAFLVSSFVVDTLVAAAGLRAYVFTVLALVAQWLAPRIGVIARSIGVLLLLQALLIPFELFRGTHTYGEWSSLNIASRVSATMVLPNSLGIFAVTALAFFYSFSPTRAWLALLSAAALAIVFLSGSGTGAVCVVLMSVVTLKDRVRRDRLAPSVLAGLIAGAVAAFALSVFLVDEWKLNSLLGDGGRLDALMSVFTERGPLETIFGAGLGTGRIAAMQLQSHVHPETLAASELFATPFYDSTVGGLVIEIGVLGTALFYAALVWAGLREPRARPFYWVVALCSLAINVTVFFPLNFMLGLAWAHSAWRAGNQRPG